MKKTLMYIIPKWDLNSSCLLDSINITSRLWYSSWWGSTPYKSLWCVFFTYVTSDVIWHVMPHFNSWGRGFNGQDCPSERIWNWYIKTAFFYYSVTSPRCIHVSSHLSFPVSRLKRSSNWSILWREIMYTFNWGSIWFISCRLLYTKPLPSLLM